MRSPGEKKCIRKTSGNRSGVGVQKRKPLKKEQVSLTVMEAVRIGPVHNITQLR